MRNLSTIVLVIVRGTKRKIANSFVRAPRVGQASFFMSLLQTRARQNENGPKIYALQELLISEDVNCTARHYRTCPIYS